MKVEILISTDYDMLIGWADKTGFGELHIMYDKKGRYTIDAEYISLKKVIEIIKLVAELESKHVIKLESDD